MEHPTQSEFEKVAQEQHKPGLFNEVLGLIRENKKYWMLPIIIVLAVFGLLVLLSGTGVAPFIYTLF